MTALAILFGVEDFQGSFHALAALFLAANAAIAAMYTWYLPYSNISIQSLRTACSWLLTWLGLCLVITVLLDDEDDRTGVLMLYTSCPLLVILSFVAVTHRKQRLLARPLTEFNSSYEVDISECAAG